MLVEARGAPREQPRGKAVLSLEPELRLKPSLILNKTRVEALPDAPARVPAALLRGATVHVEARLPRGAVAEAYRLETYIVVHGYRVVLGEQSGKGAPPKRIELNLTRARLLAAKAAEEAGLEPPTSLELGVDVEALAGTSWGSARLAAEATLRTSRGEAVAEAGRAEAMLTTGPPPPRGAEEARTGLILLSAGVLAAVPAAAQLGRSRSRRDPLPGGLVAKGSLDPGSRPVALLEDPSRLAAVAADTGEPVVVDEERGVACTATPAAVYCARLSPSGAAEAKKGRAALGAVAPAAGDGAASRPGLG